MGINIDSFKDHVSKKIHCKQHRVKPYHCLTLSEAIAENNPRAHVLKCCYEIMRRQDFLVGGKIENKAGVM